MRLDTTDAVNIRGPFSGWESGKVEVRLNIGYEMLTNIYVESPLLTIKFRECAQMPNDFIPVWLLGKFYCRQQVGFSLLAIQSTMFIWLQKVSAIQSLKFHDTSKIDMKNVPFKRQKTLQSIY